MDEAGSIRPGRNPALDGLRGLAALAIVTWHFIPSLATAQIGSPLAYVSKALGLTWIGVDVFFVLSGFLIGGILLRERCSPRYFKTFYGRRALRILPLYYLLLLLHALVRPWLPALWPATAFAWDFTGVAPWTFWAFVQNLYMPGADNFGNRLFGHTWSLALEEQFYLLIPLMVLGIKPAWLPRFLLPAICGAALLRWLVGPGLTAYVLLPCRLDALLIGVLLSWIFTDDVRRVWLARHGTSLMVSTTLLFFVVAIPVLRSGDHIHILQRSWGWLMHTWVSVVTAGLIAFLQIAPPVSIVARALSIAPLRWCGLRAYGIYLLHPWALYLSFAAWGWSTPALSEHSGWPPLLFASITTFILAAISYRWLEHPCMRLGQKLRY